MMMGVVSATLGFSSSVRAKMRIKSYLLPLSIKEFAWREFFFPEELQCDLFVCSHKVNIFFSPDAFKINEVPF